MLGRTQLALALGLLTTAIFCAKALGRGNGPLETFWINSYGGSWSNGKNWSHGVPGPDSHARFDTLEMIDDCFIFLDGPVVINRLTLGLQNSYWVTNIVTGGNSLLTTGDATINEWGRFHFQGESVLTVQGSLINTGEIVSDFADATIDCLGEFENTSDGLVHVKGTLNVPNGFLNNGMVVLESIMGTTQVTGFPSETILSGGDLVNMATIFVSDVKGFGTDVKLNMDVQNFGDLQINAKCSINAPEGTLKNWESGTIDIAYQKMLHINQNSTAVFENLGGILIDVGNIKAPPSILRLTNGGLYNFGTIQGGSIECFGTAFFNGTAPVLEGNGATIIMDAESRLFMVGGFLQNDGFISGGGLVELQNIDVLNEGYISSAVDFDEVLFQSYGTLDLVSPLASEAFETTFENFGSVYLFDSEPFVMTGGVFTNGASGIVSGPGELDVTEASMVNEGTFLPGGLASGSALGELPPGELVLNGEYVQTSTGRLRIRLGGVPFKPPFDRLTVTRQAVLSGHLSIDLINNYVPIVGTQFEVIYANEGFDGVFSVAHFPGMPGGRYLVAEYLAVPSKIAGKVPAIVTISTQLLGSSADFDPPLTDTLPNVPTAGVMADFDNDGDLDVALTLKSGIPNSPGTVLILINGGSIGDVWQGFSAGDQYAVGVDPSGIAAGFFNDDAVADLAITNRGDNNVTVLMNDGTGEFNAIGPFAVGAQPSSITTAALDGTKMGLGTVVALSDIIVTNEADNTFIVLVNEGNGVFVPTAPGQTSIQPVRVKSTDVDNDRDIDIVVTNNGSNTVSVFRNDGKGKLDLSAEIEVGLQPADVEIGNLDGDGLPEIVTTNAGDGSISVAVNDPKNPGSFLAAVGIGAGDNARSITVADYNNDGDLDLAILVGEAGDDAVQLFRNDTLAKPGAPLLLTTDIAVEAGTNAIVILTGDVDGQGGSDLVTITEGGAFGSLSAGDREPSISVFLSHAGPPCFTDVYPPPVGDGAVNVNDLLEILNHWGPCNGCAADVAPPGGDGVIGVADLNAVLDGWGGCGDNP